MLSAGGKLDVVRDSDPLDPGFLEDRVPDSLVPFVDISTPGDDITVSAGTPVDVGIDHHSGEEIDARFVDRREEPGAAATILTEYVRALDVDLDAVLATALLFAIRRETPNFLRGATSAEYEAAGYLHDHADLEMLHQLSSPAVTGTTLDAIATAISNRTTENAVLISHVGRTTERDAIPQAADYLGSLEGVDAVVVFGIVGDAIHLSARSPDPRIHIGEVLDETFSDVGSAGGHHDVTGGEIPLGLFAYYTTDDDELPDIVDKVITERLRAALDLSDHLEE